MLKLGVSTVTKTMSVCLIDNDMILGELSCQQQNIDNILIHIDSLLVSAEKTISDIDECVVINGPGTYAGIRIGLTVVKTIALVKQIPIKIINSVEVLAYQYRVYDGLIVVAMEARKDEVNFGMYGGGSFNEVLPSQVVSKDQLFSKLNQIKGNFILVGDMKIVPKEFVKQFHFATPLAKDAIILSKQKKHTTLEKVAPYYSYPVNINTKSKKLGLN